MNKLFCNKNHQVYPELNIEIDYPYFCPQCDENYYGIELTEKEMDREIAHKIMSSNGEIYLNKAGDVIHQVTSPECSKVVWFDLEQYELVWGKEPEKEIDILDIRGILADGRELMWDNLKTQLL